MLDVLDQCFAQTCDVIMGKNGSVESSLCPGLEVMMPTGNNNLDYESSGRFRDA